MTRALLSLIIAPLAGVVSLEADTINLRNGKSVDGTFVGGTARQVEFLPASGPTMKVPITDVVSVRFSAPPQPPPPPPAPAQSAQAPPSRPPVVIRAGASIRIRTTDLIDVDSSQTGAQFAAAIDDPIMSGGDVIVPRGADVVLVAAKVAQGGKFKGSDLIELKIHSIKARGRLYPVVTSVSETKSAGEGKKTTRKVVGGAG